MALLPSAQLIAQLFGSVLLRIHPKCRDQGWNTILLPDDTGFRGFTANGPTVATIVDEKHYSAEGMKVLQGGKYVVEDSDVVCFLSSGRDSAGLHSGVKVGPKDYMWPPLTMFKVSFSLPHRRR